MPLFGGELNVPDISLHEFLWERLLKYGDDIAFVSKTFIDFSGLKHAILSLPRTFRHPID